MPIRTEQSARHSLREIFYQLRQAGVEIVSDAHGVELAAEGVRSDFGDMIGGGRPDASQLRALEGGFLPGYAPTHSEAFAEWYEGYRAKSIFELCKAVLRQVAQAKSAGDWGTTEKAARACLALDPLNEEATLASAEMLAMGGARVQAVELLDRYAIEVGRTPNLRVPITILRRRIAERPPRRTCHTMTYVRGSHEGARSLIERFEIARAGRPQCVVVAGEPGIGKNPSRFGTRCISHDSGSRRRPGDGAAA